MSTHEFAVLDHHGDTPTTWALDQPDTLAAARGQFQSLKAKGYALFRLEGPDNRGIKLSAFDETATRIIAVAPIAGG